MTLTDITVRFGSVAVLDGVSVAVRPGRVTGFIGANGAGKTTLVDAVSGFNRLARGSIVLGRDDLTAASGARRAAQGIGRCFQTVELFDDLNVRDNLLAATESIRPHQWLSSLVLPRRDDLDAETRAMAEDLGLTDHLERYPDSLSHGQRRLVGVARALAARPAVLLLDEPAAGLDQADVERLGRTIRALADSGLGILLIEHDVEFVVDVSDHVVAIDFGRTIYDGPPAGVLDDPAIKTAYLGGVERTAAAEAPAADRRSRP